jgi:hypothetical protein
MPYAAAQPNESSARPDARSSRPTRVDPPARQSLLKIAGLNIAGNIQPTSSLLHRMQDFSPRTKYITTLGRCAERASRSNTTIRTNASQNASKFLDTRVNVMFNITFRTSALDLVAEKKLRGKKSHSTANIGQ